MADLEQKLNVLLALASMVWRDHPVHVDYRLTEGAATSIKIWALDINDPNKVVNHESIDEAIKYWRTKAEDVVKSAESVAKMQTTAAEHLRRKYDGLAAQGE